MVITYMVLCSFMLVYEGSLITSVELYTFRLDCDVMVITYVEVFIFRLVREGSVITSREQYI